MGLQYVDAAVLKLRWLIQTIDDSAVNAICSRRRAVRQTECLWQCSLRIRLQWGIWMACTLAHERRFSEEDRTAVPLPGALIHEVLSLISTV